MQPTSPDPQFDFMLKNNQQPKRGLPMPNLPKPLKIGLAVVIGIILLIIISSVLSGHKSGAAQPITSALARNQEIIRVTQLAQQQLHLQDPTTQAVAATTYTTLSSEQQQLAAYLATIDTKKLSKAALAADTDKSTDAQLTNASQNNSLDQAYITYLKQSLVKYQVDIQAGYKVAGPKGKAILKSAFDSIDTLLTAPPLKS